MLLELLAHADACVTDNKFILCTALRSVPLLLNLQADKTADLVELHAVAQNIQQHLRQPQPVSNNMLMHNIYSIKHKIQLLRSYIRLNNRADFLQQLRQMQRLLQNSHLAAFDTAHIQHIINKRQQMLTSYADFLQIILQHFWLIHMRSRQRGEADNRVHRRADIMRHAVEELRLGTVGLLCCGQRSCKLLITLMVCQHQIIDIFKAHNKISARNTFINKSIAYLEILYFTVVMSTIDNIINRLFSDFCQHSLILRFLGKIIPVILMDTQRHIIAYADNIARILPYKLPNFFYIIIISGTLISSDEAAIILNQPHARILTRQTIDNMILLGKPVVNSQQLLVFRNIKKGCIGNALAQRIGDYLAVQQQIARASLGISNLALKIH